jgi:hypothetical protein
MRRAVVIAMMVVLAPMFAATQTPDRNDYAKAENWLCRPDKANDACSVDLTTAVVAADGTITR